MRLSALFAVPAVLLATSAFGGGLGEMSDVERDAFREEVRSYLVEHPEVLIEAMNVLQDREAQTAAARDQQMLADNKDVIFNDGVSWVGGNPNGDVTVVEFMDYRCGYCRKAYSEVEELVKSDGNIRFVLKEYPILGEDSMVSSRFAIAVQQLHGAETYKKVHDALIALRGAPDADTLGRLATDMGLDANAILVKMASDEVTKVIADNHALADKLEISGTPTFVVDGTMLRGYVPLDAMRQIVADERS